MSEDTMTGQLYDDVELPAEFTAPFDPAPSPADSATSPAEPSSQGSTGRKKWRSCPDALYPVEEGVAMRELGITAGQVNDYLPEYTALAAVLLARRDDYTIPLDTWKTLRRADIEQVAIDFYDEADPTRAA